MLRLNQLKTQATKATLTPSIKDLNIIVWGLKMNSKGINNVSQDSQNQSTLLLL